MNRGLLSNSRKGPESKLFITRRTNVIKVNNNLLFCGEYSFISLDDITSLAHEIITIGF